MTGVQTCALPISAPAVETNALLADRITAARNAGTNRRVDGCMVYPPDTKTLCKIPDFSVRIRARRRPGDPPQKGRGGLIFIGARQTRATACDDYRMSGILLSTQLTSSCNYYENRLPFIPVAPRKKIAGVPDPGFPNEEVVTAREKQIVTVAPCCVAWPLYDSSATGDAPSKIPKAVRCCRKPDVCHFRLVR